MEIQRRLEQIAVSDELTGLLNRRGFTMMAGHLHKMATRQRNGLAVVFADLDGLKRINDQLGHDHGDRAIRELADVLRSTFRSSDVVARLGGDEFAVLVHAVDRGRLDVALDRLGASVAAVNAHPDRPFALSVSLGVAMFDPATPLTLDELIGEADKRMYDHKQSRRAARAS
jgi:diguanylate cyclase (GGDEF)-like protein